MKKVAPFVSWEEPKHSRSIIWSPSRSWKNEKSLKIAKTLASFYTTTKLFFVMLRKEAK